jgi:hypothetical protein
VSSRRETIGIDNATAVRRGAVFGRRLLAGLHPAMACRRAGSAMAHPQIGTGC